MNQSSFPNWIFCREQNEVMSNVRAVPRRPGTPGSPLDTVKKLNANPLLCHCMHAGSAASPQQSSHVQQHNTKKRSHNGWLWRPGRQRAAGLWTRCWSHWNIYRGVFCCFCAEWLKEESSETAPPPSPPTVYLAFWWGRKSPENNSWGWKKKKIKTKTVCLANIRLWVHIGCSRSEDMRGRVWSLRILIREELESGIIHHLLGADSNTSAASCRRQTVFVKHVRVTEQQRVRRTVD